ncbi:MAG: tyrosine-type recombinase/integrase [Chloroflexi bacterium]|nr:tyrosine-type recombinase/integrase [Chloroflexota bacterium]
MDESIRKFERYLGRRYPNRSTMKHYVSDSQIFQRFANKPPRQVTKLDIANFVEDQLGRGLAATTVNRRLACLHHFFEFLADEADDDTWANPIIWRQHRVKEGKPLPRDLSDAEVERLFAGIDHPRDRLMFGLMYWAGLRVGEVAALRVSDFIPAGNPEKGARLRVRGKGQKERVVPLTPALTQQWEEWLAQRLRVENDALFVTRRKKGISERGIQNRLAHYARQTGVAVTCHRLRHTFGRRMVEAKMPLPTLSKLLGHEQVTTTQVYIAGAGVDVRADYEAAMGRLEAERPGPPLFLALPPEPVGVPPSPKQSSVDEGGATVIPPEVSAASLDVSRFWADLPAWLTESLADYIAYQQRRWKPSQVAHHARNRSQTLRQVWCWLVEERDVSGFAALGRRDVEAYVDARLRADVAASTLNRQLRDLWAFLRFVEERGQPVSPGVFRVARLKEGKPLPRFLTDEEYRRLETVIRNKTAAGTRDDRLDRAWFYLLAHGGLRLGELCDLRLGDVDSMGQRLVIREGKGKRDRVIPLSETAVTMMDDYLVVRGTAWTDHLLIFRQQAIKPNLVQSRLSRYGKAVGMAVSSHRLRHTLATRLVNVGMDIVSIQRLLGHEKLATTMIYARVHDTTVERDFRQAMTRLEANQERRPAVDQTEPTSLVEEFFSHIHEPVFVATQALNCV